MNKKTFEGLTADEQAVVLEVAAEAVAMQRELSISKEDEMTAALEADGMTVNRDVDGAAF